MAVKVKVTGINECINQLNKIVGDVQSRRAVRAIHSVLIIGGGRAATYTPVGDTSNLINSQYREVVFNGSHLIGRVGYTANYAAYVHDPNRPMKFRLARAKKEFLYKGFEDERETIDMVMRKELHI
ncbi:hypothetical protein [Gilliamella sp. Bif1-4]|uniref:hypothetical protein n=1 Tax=Gilliamella sp. Bif1-4 TaxID=3120233 RepID=UPI00080E8ACF|nr:hypothetical protein [Gilliamella apicola]OCG39781.1 hypothetical protein A9G25_10310 [Gilliamella apicola]